MSKPTEAKIEIKYESGHTTTALLNPEQAEKVLQGMRNRSISRPLPDFKNILLSDPITIRINN